MKHWIARNYKMAYFLFSGVGPVAALFFVVSTRPPLSDWAEALLYIVIFVGGLAFVVWCRGTSPMTDGDLKEMKLFGMMRAVQGRTAAPALSDLASLLREKEVIFHELHDALLPFVDAERDAWIPERRAEAAALLRRYIGRVRQMGKQGTGAARYDPAWRDDEK